jgi:magnesium chelatase family protein
MEQLNLSARAHSRILKVARTLADMDGRETLSFDDVMEAIQYRSLDRRLWA